MADTSWGEDVIVSMPVYIAPEYRRCEKGLALWADVDATYRTMLASGKKPETVDAYNRALVAYYYHHKNAIGNGQPPCLQCKEAALYELNMGGQG